MGCALELQLLDSVTDKQASLSRMLTGSGRLTYTGLAGFTGIAFVGLLGAAMFKNINNEGAFSDVSALKITD